MAISTLFVFPAMVNPNKIHAWPEVKKNSGEINLTAKAWNGRVICAWLAHCMTLAAANFDIHFDEGRLALACHASMLEFLSK